MNQRKILLDALLKLRRYINREGYYNGGICAWLLNNVHELDMEVMHKLFACWPKYSGKRGYPVPSPDGDSPDFAYSCFPYSSFWKPYHPYGALRLELLDYCIKELEND